jgi:aspartate/methionine/tyrosine aminotransferase
MFPERFSNLPAYPFSRLRTLLDAHAPGDTAAPMAIGEPTHAFPQWILQIIQDHSVGFNSYPPNDGTPEFRGAITAWIAQRYGVPIDPNKNVIALNGTREGLYNAAMALCPQTKAGKKPVILTPNPFYQVYMFAALSVGAQPEFVPATKETGFLPDYAGLDLEILDRASLAYICSPANPQGAVADRSYWQDLIRLAEKHDFRILADECYSEIYRTAPPVGALQVAHEMGADPDRVMIFHSLSKRSNLPGLRSGFAASGEKVISLMKTMRAYSGAPLPLPLQKAAEAVWLDEKHVQENRRLYVEKFALADDIFGDIAEYTSPEGGFFLWLACQNGEEAALELWKEDGIRVLPGRYLSQDVNNQNPGDGYIRVALVAPKDQIEIGLRKLRNRLYR